MDIPYVDNRETRETMEWKHKGSPATKKFKVTPSVGNVMRTFFEDHKGIIHIEYMSNCTTRTIGAYFHTLMVL